MPRRRKTGISFFGIAKSSTMGLSLLGFGATVTTMITSSTSDTSESSKSVAYITEYNAIKTFINDVFMNFLIKRDAITLRENAFNFDSIVTKLKNFTMIFEDANIWIKFIETVKISIRNEEDDPNARQEIDLTVIIQRPEIVIQQSGIRIEIDEDESLPFLDPQRRQPDFFRVQAFYFFDGDSTQSAIEVVGPPVERAREHARIAGTDFNDLRKPVPTDIMQRVKFAVVVPDNEYRFPEHRPGEVIAGVFRVVPTPYAQPMFLQYVLDFVLVDLLIMVTTCWQRPLDAIDAVANTGDFFLSECRNVIGHCLYLGYVSS